jgi:hypothetical protein
MNYWAHKTNLRSLGIPGPAAEAFLIGAEMAARASTFPNEEVIDEAVSNLIGDAEAVERLKRQT